MIKDYFIFAFNNLKYRGLRSWLTMLGIFIGIAAVVSLISLGQGLQNAITSEFNALGGDTIIIQSKTIGPPGSTTNPALILTTKDLEIIKKTRGVRDAAGVLIKSGPVKSKDELNIVLSIGGNSEYMDLFNKESQETLFKISDGRMFKDNEKDKAVVGYNNVYGDLWKDKLRLKSKITLEGREFSVVGVREKTGNPFDDNAILVPKDTLKEILNTGDEESQIVAKVSSGFEPSDVAKSIKSNLRKFRNEKEDQETFSVQTSEQILDAFSTIFSMVQAVLIGIAAISLVVGGIGIMNTMYTSVLERTKEIGIMKAIGARNSDVLMIFLIESGLLGLAGGLIGVILGIGLSTATEIVAKQALGTNLLQASFSPYLIIGALLFSFIVGSLSGIMPARQAAKMKPVDALRYE